MARPVRRVRSPGVDIASESENVAAVTVYLTQVGYALGPDYQIRKRVQGCA